MQTLPHHRDNACPYYMTCIKITNRWTDPSTSKCVLSVFQHIFPRLRLEIPWMYPTSNIKHITWRYH